MQAPQSPKPQPYLVPVRFAASRRPHSKGVIGSMSISDRAVVDGEAGHGGRSRGCGAARGSPAFSGSPHARRPRSCAGCRGRSSRPGYVSRCAPSNRFSPRSSTLIPRPSGTCTTVSSVVAAGRTLVSRSSLELRAGVAQRCRQPPSGLGRPGQGAACRQPGHLRRPLAVECTRAAARLHLGVGPRQATLETTSCPAAPARPTPRRAPGWRRRSGAGGWWGSASRWRWRPSAGCRTPSG